MIAQRMRHMDKVDVLDESGTTIRHKPELIRNLFDEELDRLLRENAKDNDDQAAATLREARALSEEMILRGEFNPRVRRVISFWQCALEMHAMRWANSGRRNRSGAC
jgi:hypothetical protein